MAQGSGSTTISPHPHRPSRGRILGRRVGVPKRGDPSTGSRREPSREGLCTTAQSREAGGAPRCCRPRETPGAHSLRWKACLLHPSGPRQPPYFPCRTPFEGSRATRRAPGWHGAAPCTPRVPHLDPGLGRTEEGPGEEVSGKDSRDRRGGRTGSRRGRKGLEAPGPPPQ